MALESVPTVIAADIGNTTIRLAAVTGEDVSPVQTAAVGELSSLGNMLRELRQDDGTTTPIAAASVNPVALKAFEAAVSESLNRNVLVVGRDLPIPIDLAVDQVDTVGVDRSCCAAAAFDRLGRACVVADFGTAITIDAVDENGQFLGGAIMPGLKMSAEALHNTTAQLPAVTPTNPTWVYGKNTTNAIVGGIVFGARGALRQLTEAYAIDMRHWPVVIATGGDAELVCGENDDAGLVQAIVPDLALRGVAMAFYRHIVGP